MQDDDDDEDERPATRFYKSENILGKLYRSIDEVEFLQHRQNVMERSSAMAAPSVLSGVWAYVQNETDGFLWNHHVGLALDIRQMYVIWIAVLFPSVFFPPLTFFLSFSFLSVQLRR